MRVNIWSQQHSNNKKLACNLEEYSFTCLISEFPELSPDFASFLEHNFINLLHAIQNTNLWTHMPATHTHVLSVSFFLPLSLSICFFLLSCCTSLSHHFILKCIMNFFQFLLSFYFGVFFVIIQFSQQIQESW